MKRILLSALVVATAGGLVGCDSPTEATSIDVTLTATPDPATATASSGMTYDVTNPDSTVSTYEYQYRASFVVTAKENDAHAVDITAVNATVQQASGGIVVTPSGGKSVYSTFDFVASGNHIAANGSVSTTVNVYYTLPNKGKESLVTVAMSFKDDDGYTASDSVDVKVAP
jgi:hypothetical protein